MIEIDYTALNPGIAATVRWLRENGFETCDSGDGETHDHACDLAIPYVHITCKPDALYGDAKRLQHALKSIGVITMSQNSNGTAPSIEASWNPAESFATISLFNVRIVGCSQCQAPTRPDITAFGSSAPLCIPCYLETTRVG